MEGRKLSLITDKRIYADELMDAVVNAHKKGKKVLICGNGGLASESEHFAAEMMGKFAFEIYVPCIALTSNSALITALSNDIGFEEVFSNQVKVLGKKGDVFIGMTTSNSENIVRALKIAKEKGLITVAICGEKSKDFEFADYTIKLHGEETAAVQNDAISFLHYLAYNIKRRLR